MTSHTHHISTDGGNLEVKTFSNEFEERNFHSLVRDKADKIFSQNLPENKGKTIYDIRSKVFDELIYVYLSNELEGFDNYDKPFSDRLRK